MSSTRASDACARRGLPSGASKIMPRSFNILVPRVRFSQGVPVNEQTNDWRQSSRQGTDMVRGFVFTSGSIRVFDGKLLPSPLPGLSRVSIRIIPVSRKHWLLRMQFVVHSSSQCQCLSLMVPEICVLGKRVDHVRLLAEASTLLTIWLHNFCACEQRSELCSTVGVYIARPLIPATNTRVKC